MEEVNEWKINFRDIQVHIDSKIKKLLIDYKKEKDEHYKLKFVLLSEYSEDKLYWKLVRNRQESDPLDETRLSSNFDFSEVIR